MNFLTKKKSAKQTAKEQAKIEAWLKNNEMQDFESTDLNFVKKAVAQLNHDGLADVTMLTGNIGEISRINGLTLRGIANQNWLLIKQNDKIIKQNQEMIELMKAKQTK